MRFWQVLITAIGYMAALKGAYCDGGLWLIEQEFVKFGKKDVYEEHKKEQQTEFLKKIDLPRYAIDDIDSSQYIYLIPVKDFKGLQVLMQKRMSYHKALTSEDRKHSLIFLSTVNFFIESLHDLLSDCSFIPKGKENLLDYPAVYYTIYGIIPGNGPIFEDRLRSIAKEQETSLTPICFRTWRVLFGGGVPSYIVAVFGETTKEAKGFAKELQVVEGSMKNLLRQEKKGAGVIRKDLTAFGGKNGF